MCFCCKHTLSAALVIGKQVNGCMVRTEKIRAGNDLAMAAEDEAGRCVQHVIKIAAAIKAARSELTNLKRSRKRLQMIFKEAYFL